MLLKKMRREAGEIFKPDKITTKHEKVSEWEERTGETYPDDGPVWFKGVAWECDWTCRDYEQVQVRCEINNEPMTNYYVIVANHHGKPDSIGG